MKKFILGFVMAIISIVGVLIFVVRKAIVKAARISNFSPIQEFAKEFVKNTIDILFWGRVRSEEERNPFDYRSYHAQEHNDICKAIDKCMAKPYFIDVEEYGCGYSNDYYEFKPADSHESTTVFVDGMSKIIHGGIYMEHSFKRMDQLDWIAVMMGDMLGKDIDPEEDGKHYYIHDPRDGTDYDIRVTINYKDERRYFIEEKEFGGDGIYKKEYYNYLWDKRKLMWLPVDINGGPKQIEVSCPEWLINMLWGYLSGETFYIRDQVEDKDYCIYTKFSFEPDSDDVKGD